MQFIWLSVCVKKSFLCSHDRRCIDRGNHKVRVWNIQHTKSGTTRKIENNIYALVCKQQPNLKMQA